MAEGDCDDRALCGTLTLAAAAADGGKLTTVESDVRGGTNDGVCTGGEAEATLAECAEDTLCDCEGRRCIE